MTFGMEKLQFTNVTDGQTHTQTPHDGIGQACIARGKKRTNQLKK